MGAVLVPPVSASGASIFLSPEFSATLEASILSSLSPDAILLPSDAIPATAAAAIPLGVTVGFGFKIPGSGLRFKGSGFRVQG